MTEISRHLRDLDLSLFDCIPSQTSNEDRRALLGVQRAVMRRQRQFAYLEIGSHLGGSIQPYLVNPTCTHIYSIDPRPLLQSDDRAEAYIADYPENSTSRMLGNLRAIDPEAVCKVQCFEADARDVDVAAIEIRPMIAFIDGEHTREAVNSDFDFCLRVVATGGVIVFHDFPIIYKAIFDALHKLRGSNCLAYLIEGTVFSIFLDPALVHEDEYLYARYKEHCHHHRWHAMKQALSPFMPKLIKSIYRRARGNSA